MSSSTGLRFYVGTTESGEAVYGDFQTAGHFISAGGTGSGHASFDEAAFVTYMIQNYAPDELQFVMIDPKQVQLIPYENIPHLWRPLAMTPDSTKDAITALHAEMVRRFQLWANQGVRFIADYNARSAENLPSMSLYYSTRCTRWLQFVLLELRLSFLPPLLYVTESADVVAWQRCQGGALLTFTGERTTLMRLIDPYNEGLREVRSFI